MFIPWLQPPGWGCTWECYLLGSFWAVMRVWWEGSCWCLWESEKLWDQCFGCSRLHGTIQHSLAHKVVVMATSHSRLIVSSEINSLGIYCWLSGNLGPTPWIASPCPCLGLLYPSWIIRQGIKIVWLDRCRWDVSWIQGLKAGGSSFPKKWWAGKNHVLYIYSFIYLFFIFGCAWSLLVHPSWSTHARSGRISSMFWCFYSVSCLFPVWFAGAIGYNWQMEADK